MKKVKKVRPILQMETTECGAASLAMILDYYGKTVTLEELRNECGVSRNGVNAKNIVKAARFHNLNTRAIRVGMDSVKNIQTPAIIHWNMDHFLVLCGFNKKGAVIADPAYGIRTVPEEEFSRSFTGIAIELTPAENFKKNEKNKHYGDYIGSCVKAFLPNIAYFICIEICMIIGSCAILFLNSIFIDKILIGGNTQSLGIILKTLLCAGVITVLAMMLNENIIYHIGKRLNMKINSGFIKHILKLPIEFFLQRNEGDLANRENANIQMGINISNMLAPIPGYILQIVVYIILLVALDIHIAIIGIACAAVNIFAIVKGSKKYEDKMRSHIRNMGALQGRISETVDLIETIKSCGGEDAVLERLISSGTAVLNTKSDIDKTDAYQTSLFSFLNALGSGAVLIVGVWEILSGSMTAGILISAQALVAAMLQPVGATVNTAEQMQSLREDAARTNDVMHYGEDKKFLDEDSEQTKAIDGDIELKNVSFKYNPLESAFIENFDLTVKKGGSVAITGKSGSGKSTVAKIIAGLYSESGGTVTFNGARRDEINRSYFYSKTAVVSQNIRLFEGSVMDNITMWDSSVSYEDAVRAAKAACIHEDIISRSDGYRETVTENGRNFSGGQRQRIEIARAIAKKPSVIIMDEATSALDTDTEEQIMNNIKSLGITMIVVAHRLSTIMDSDEIIVMDGGKIAERGKHDELMKKKGIYYSLVKGG